MRQWGFRSDSIKVVSLAVAYNSLNYAPYNSFSHGFQGPEPRVHFGEGSRRFQMEGLNVEPLVSRSQRTFRGPLDRGTFVIRTLPTEKHSRGQLGCVLMLWSPACL